jgi:hypothetical protein
MIGMLLLAGVYKISVDRATEVRIVWLLDKLNSWKQYSYNLVCLIVYLITITTLANVLSS